MIALKSALGDMEPRKSLRNYVIACAVIALPWIVGTVLFNGIERFPHNDDWLYARSVQGWMKSGDYHHVTQHGELAASVVAHVAWGKVFHFAQPFSMKTLHLSQAVAAWLGCCAVFVLARHAGVCFLTSCSLALVLAVCPLFYGHSFTFMTDVTALSLVAIAMLCFHLALRDLPNRVSQLWLVSGGIVTALAFWCRQTHILCLVYPGLLLLMHCKEMKFRGIRRHLGLLVVIPLSAVLAFEWNLIVPGNNQRMGIVLPKDWDLYRWKQIAIHLYGMCLIVGLLALPLFPFLARSAFCYRPIGRICSAGWVTAVVAIGLLGLFTAYGGRLFITQTTGYFLQNGHFGPILLADAGISSMADVIWPEWIWQVISVGCILSFSVVVWWTIKLATAAESIVKRRTMAMAGFGVVVILFMLALITAVMDRYWIILFVPCGYVLATALVELKAVVISPWWRRTGILIGVSLFWLSLAMTHDLLAWNEQRGQQMQQWIERGIKDEHLDAGADLNGWLLSEHDPNTMQRDGDLTRSWRGFARFCILHRSEAPEGWVEDGQRNWFSWATMSEQTMYMYRKP